MTKDELIDEFLRQGIRADSLVRIVIGDQQIFGNLTDARIKAPDDDCQFHLIGIVLKAPPGKIMPKYPMSVAVEQIESIELL